MANDHLAAYLNDHLAGSVVAVELLERLERAHAGTPLERALVDLRTDIETDREELRRLMGRLDVAESRVRRASAWFTEKAAELKLAIDDRSAGVFRLFEGLEAVSLGIEGKRALWQALMAAAAESAALAQVDYPRLILRAEQQRERTEAMRLAAAKRALTPEN